MAPDNSGPSPATSTSTSVERAVVDLQAEAELSTSLAAARSDASAPALAMSPTLTEGARAWARQLATTGVLRHNPGFAELVRSGSGRPCGLVAENVGVGSKAQLIEAALMNSAPHRANMLEPTFNVAGLGAVRDAKGTIWVVQLFCAA